MSGFSRHVRSVGDKMLGSRVWIITRSESWYGRYMNLAYYSGRRMMDARFIESHLGGIISLVTYLTLFYFTMELSQVQVNRMNIVLSFQVTVDYIRLWV